MVKMKVVVIVVVISLLIFFLSGCYPAAVCTKPYTSHGNSCCLDNNDNSVCDENESIPTPVKENGVKKTEGSQKQYDYDLNQLEEDIDSLTDIDYIWNNDGDYYDSNKMRAYVIENPNEEIISYSDFYNRFSAQNWQGYHHFINGTNLKRLQPDLSRDKFTSEKRFNDYLLYRSIIEQTVMEQTLEVENGKVLEYQFINWVFDNNDYFDGEWEDTLLIYKVYCSPHIVVYLRPRQEQTDLILSGAKKPAVYNNWESAVLSIRKELLDKSNEVLGKCPVEKSSFSFTSEKKFKSTKSFYYYFPADLEFFRDVSTQLSTKIEPAKNGDGNVIDGYLALQQVDVTFTNHDTVDIKGPLLLDIETMADGKDRKMFATEKKMGSSLKVNEPSSRMISSEVLPRFSNNLTIYVSLYVEEGGLSFIRPTEYVLFTDNTLVKK